MGKDHWWKSESKKPGELQPRNPTSMAKSNISRASGASTPQMGSMAKSVDSATTNNPSATSLNNVLVGTLPPNNPKEISSSILNKNVTSLWKIAFESGGLTEDQKLALGTPRNASSNWSPKDFVTDVVELTKERFAEYEASGWHIKTGHKDINVNHEAKKILCSVLRLKDLIDAGLTFDPTGYGASAWTIISFTLQLVQNDQDRMDAIFQASAYLADILARYASIEKHYNNKKVDDTEQLQQGIVNVYVAVLEYSAEVKTAERSGLAKRVLASFRSLTEESLQSLKDKIATVESNTDKWRSYVEHEYRMEENERINAAAGKILSEVTEMAKDLKIVQTIAISEEEQSILDWLSNVSHSAKWKRLRKRIGSSNPQSGQWLLTSAEFEKWKSLPQETLWLYGRSGCGKSCLCSTIIDHLESVCSGDKRKILISWNFDSDDKSTQDIENMLRSLIRQLSAGTDAFPKAVTELAARHRKRGSEPDVEELMPIFQAVIHGLKKDVFLIIDAIDEYHEIENDPGRQDLLIRIQEMIEEGHGNLHLLMTSRKEDDIIQSFNSLKHAIEGIDIEKRILVDLDLFIRTKMDSTPALKDLSDHIKAEIELQVSKKEEKLFLWTASLLEAVGKCRGDEDQIIHVLSNLPMNMEASYQEALTGIPNNDVNIAKSILSLVAVQMRRLTLDEIADYAKLNNTSYVKEICNSNLLMVDEDGFVQFTHPSVKRYLMSDKLRISKGGVSLFFISPDEAHNEVAERCLDYLLPRKRSNSSTKAFQRYSAEYWQPHAKAIKGSPENSRLDSLVYELFEPNSSNAFLNWLRFFDPDEPPGPPKPNLELEDCPSPVYYAILLGFPKMALSLIDSNTDVNRPGVQGSALEIAAIRGYTGVVQQLLAKGPVLSVGKEKLGFALYAASANTDVEMIQALITAGANLDWNQGQYGTPLQCASRLGNIEVVRLLLGAGADVNAKGGMFGTALQAASATGQFEVVRLLLDHGADSQVHSGLLESSLQAAVAGGYDNIVDLLVANGVKYSAKKNMCWKDAYIQALSSTVSSLSWDNIVGDLPQTPITNGDELTSNQQLLAMAHLRGVHYTRFVQSRKHSKRSYWKSTANPSTEPEPVIASQFLTKDDLNTEGYLFKQLFWAGLLSLEVSMLQAEAPKNDSKSSYLPKKSLSENSTEALITEMSEIAHRVSLYESTALQGNDPSHQKLEESVQELCSNLFLVMQWAMEKFTKLRSRRWMMIKISSLYIKEIREPWLSYNERLKALVQKCEIDYDSIIQNQQMSMLDQIRAGQAEMTTEVQRAVSLQMQKTRADILDNIQDLRGSILQDITTTISRQVELEISKAFERLKLDIAAMVEKQIDDRLRASVPSREE